ncbi:hypothetical protein ACFE04_022108 [Oxalis oulophora]
MSHWGVSCDCCQLSSKEFSYHEFAPKKKISSSIPHVRSLRLPVRPHVEAVKISVAVCETSKFRPSEDGENSFEKQHLVLGHCDPADCPPKKERKTRQRRKLEHGNKGKVPWNKGRTHSAETRARIKQRTLEALSNPKVKEKMSANPRPHSDQTKARIQSSLRRIWGKRLKWKRSREKLYHSWLESIANYAKMGAKDEEELDWDSYEKMKQTIAAQQLQRAADKATAIEMLKKRKERAAEAKAEKIAKIAQRRKDREEQEKRKIERKQKAQKKSKKDNGKPVGIEGVKLKRRLTKIHKRKILNGQMAMQGDTLISHIAAGDKVNIELLKKERMKITVSLADQIQAAKNKRAESTHMEILSASSTSQPYDHNK